MTRIRSKLLAGFAALACSLLARACVYPFDFWPLAFLCWVPLLVALEDESRVSRALFLLMTGMGSTILGFHFVPAAVSEVNGLAPLWGYLALLFLALVQSLHLLVVGALLPPGRPFIYLFPFVLAVMESFSLGPFPWFQGTLLQAIPPLLQGAALGGTAVLSLFSASINSLFALFFRSFNWRYLALASFLLASAWGAGSARIASLEKHEKERHQPPFRVGVVQSAYSTDELRRTETIPYFRSQSLSLLEDDGALDLLVWPEAASTAAVDSSGLKKRARDYWFRDRRSNSARVSVPVLLGVPFRDAEGLLFNAALLVSPSGELVGKYEKRELVPIGEAQLDVGPLSFEAAAPFERGRESVPLDVGSHHLQISICVEDLHPALVERDVLKWSPDLLVNLSSAGWFSGPAAGELHFQLSKLRTVENGLSLLRVSNRGVTVWVDAVGRTRERFAATTPSQAVWELPLARIPVLSAPVGIRWWGLALVTLLTCSFSLNWRGSRTTLRGAARSVDGPN